MRMGPYTAVREVTLSASVRREEICDLKNEDFVCAEAHFAFSGSDNVPDRMSVMSFPLPVFIFSYSTHFFDIGYKLGNSCRRMAHAISCQTHTQRLEKTDPQTIQSCNKIK